MSQWNARRRAANHQSNTSHPANPFHDRNGQTPSTITTAAATTTTTTTSTSGCSKSPSSTSSSSSAAAARHAAHDKTSKGRSIMALLGGGAGRRSRGNVRAFASFVALVGLSLLLRSGMMDGDASPAAARTGPQTDLPARAAADRGLRQRQPPPAASSSASSSDKLIEARNGTAAPVLLKDVWTRPTHWILPELMARVGHYPQYVKDLYVQPYRRRRQRQQQQLGIASHNNEFCILPGIEIAKLLGDHDVLFFTNNLENDQFMEELRKDYSIPNEVRHITGFEVFSALGRHQSHSFHAHGETWLGQVEGRRMWWFVPPTGPAPDRVNACSYLSHGAEPPEGAVSLLQSPGDVVWFPRGWYHATCALDDWTVGIGWQQGATIRQRFPALGQVSSGVGATVRPSTSAIIEECLPNNGNPSTSRGASPGSAAENAVQASSSKAEAGAKDWKWFDGDLNAYYNSLEKDERRDPNKIGSYAVHRWLGPARSTEEHYKLIYSTAATHHPPPEKRLRVLDGGCGLGSGLMWMEQRAPHWDLTGYTISDEQFKFITQSLPAHKFRARLQSYNDLEDGSEYDVIYSIEALIHSEDMAKTLQEWTQHLAPGGIITIIDDFLAAGQDKANKDMQSFAKSWLANSLVTIDELGAIADVLGLEIVENRDLLAEYKIIEVNYRNTKPAIQPFGGRTHQGWMGSKWRQRLTVEGRLIYNMVVLKKPEPRKLLECTEVPSELEESDAKVDNIVSQLLMTGHGNDGGQPMSCISGWYCCDKGTEWYDNMTTKRTEKKVDYLHLDRNLLGHYMEVFTRHLNGQYRAYPTDAGGRFLDIGGTGSTAVGMKQVTSKFQHFAGPLEYWKLDSDSAAKSLDRTLFCDIDNCPQADTCGFDVTFSHTVLEHSARPWLAFDTIARITKKGGLTMHLVPWSYQYHATPDDNFRFSHTALQTLLEDRGFDVLEVGYDICTKQQKMLKRVDEHYDVIWLTYVVGRKR